MVVALYEALTARTTDSRAVAVVTDVRIPEISDAIRVEVEHREGIALAVLLPYTAKRLRRGHEFQDMRVEAAQRRLWQ